MIDVEDGTWFNDRNEGGKNGVFLAPQRRGRQKQNLNHKEIFKASDCILLEKIGKFASPSLIRTKESFARLLVQSMVRNEPLTGPRNLNVYCLALDDEFQ